MVVCPGRLTVLKAPASPRSAAGQHPPGQVAGVDELKRSVARPGRDDPAAPGQSLQPPRQPADVLVRPEDEAGPGQQRTIGEVVEHGQFGSPLVRGVVVGLSSFGVGVDGRGRLVRAGRHGPSVHRRRRHIAVVPDAVAQQPAATRDDGRGAGPGVDHRIPGPTGQARFQLARPAAIGAQRFDTRSVRAAEAPVDRRHVVASGQSRLHHSAADEMGTAEDEQLHKPILPQSEWAAQPSPMSARTSSTVRWADATKPGFVSE